MNKKEMYLKFIKDFNNISIYDILKEVDKKDKNYLSNNKK